MAQATERDSGDAQRVGVRSGDGDTHRLSVRSGDDDKQRFGDGDSPRVGVRLTDVTAEAGIDFVHTLGDAGMTNIVEATGAGCGFIDYDGDGRLDIYFVNGCWKEGISDPKIQGEERRRLMAATDRLYRNKGDGTFEDVTARAGIERPGYGMAVVAADYDGDGDQDIYVTNHGPNFLYRNNGDGTFTEVAGEEGVDDPAFSVGAVFFDADRDGHLDLYVGNYLTYDPERTPEHARDVVRSPLAYDGQQDRLYRNTAGDRQKESSEREAQDDGGSGGRAGSQPTTQHGRGATTQRSGNDARPEDEGTPAPGGRDTPEERAAARRFVDVTEASGIAVRPVGRAMGVGAFDYDADGRVDVFVSNDAMENFLFHNKSVAGRPRFENDALLAGVAFSEAGSAAAAMAVEIGDIDHDGRFDILVPDMNLCCLYRNLGDGMFEDIAVRSGIGVVMNPFHSWGGVLADFDLDGRLDLFITNGHAGEFEPQENRLFVGDGSGRFRDVSEHAGPALRAKSMSRGVARGDYDNDGDVDLLVLNLNGAPSLLRNDTPREERHWLTVRLEGGGPNRDAVGAVVRVRTRRLSMSQPRITAGSYLCQHDARLHFGLAGAGRVDRIEVLWPDGSTQSLDDVAADQHLTIRRE